MILLLLSLWRELLLNNSLKKQNSVHFLALCYETDFLANFFFLQTNHLRKFLEFRVGMGIVDNMVAKCKYVIVVVLVSANGIDFFFNLK